IMEAQALANDDQFAGARAVLEPLVSSGAPPAIRERARSLVGRVAARERARTESAEAGRAALPIATPGLQNASASTPDSAPPTPSRIIVQYRVVQPGEQRVEGSLDRIECSPNGVSIHLRTADRTERFPAPALEDVQFMTYRADVGSVSCGARNPPDRVYLTYRPDAKAPAASLGIVVAVEFLPR
ncbi:MAG: hypothetical protein ACREKH_16915, partial [Candidatus Rokuibacteriota bacterium]